VRVVHLVRCEREKQWRERREYEIGERNSFLFFYFFYLIKASIATVEPYI
jgi:hypothetical protein